MDKKRWKVECPTCEGTGQIVTGWDEDAYENIESDCPDCGTSGEIEVVPVVVIENVISTLAPRRKKVQLRADELNISGFSESYPSGICTGQALAYGSALYHLRKILSH